MIEKNAPNFKLGKNATNHKNFAADTAEYLGGPKDIKEELEKVMQFEMDLAKISAPKEERRNKSKLYNPTTLGEFPTGNLLPDSWTEFAQKSFEVLDLKFDFDDTEKVIIYDKNFYANLTSVLEKTELRTMANYIGWRIASSTMAYLDKNAIEIRQKYKKALNGIATIPAPWKRCIKATGKNPIT